MQIRKLSTIMASAAILGAGALTATMAGATADGAAAACTPSWKLAAVHDQDFGAIGSVSVASADNVWFTYADRDDEYWYTQKWNARWNGHALASAPLPRELTSNRWYGYGSSFDSHGDGWFLVEPEDGQYSGDGAYTYAEHWQNAKWTLGTTALDPAYERDNSHGVLLRAVDTLSASDAWAVGDYDGMTLMRDNSPYGALIEHWDGTSWKIVPNPLSAVTGAELQAVAARSPQDVWAVGYQPPSSGNDHAVPLVEHWDGTSWRVAPTPDLPSGATLGVLSSVSATGGQVWAAGYTRDSAGYGHPLVEWFDGGAWHIETLPEAAHQTGTGVYAASASDVWVSVQPESSSWGLTGQARTGGFLHWNGRTWSFTASPGPQEFGRYYAYTTIGGSGPDDIWAAGYLYEPNHPVPSLDDKPFYPIIAHYGC